MKNTIRGIYSIRCLKNDYVYIGASCNIKERQQTHLSRLKKNKHENNGLQEDFIKYGCDNFIFSILEIIDDKSDLLVAENKWLIKNSQNHLYNKIHIKEQKKLSIEDTDRFWSFVCKGSEDECWPWIGNISNGYGVFSFNGNSRASRISYYLKYGDLPQSKLVLHTCDNPSCCNPSHLYLGSYSDNAVDRCNKGRSSNNKLSLELAKLIREKYKEIGNASAKDTKVWLKNNLNIDINIRGLNSVLSNSCYYDSEYTVTSRSLIKVTEDIVTFIRNLDSSKLRFKDMQKIILNTFNLKLSVSYINQIFNKKYRCTNG